MSVSDPVQAPVDRGADRSCSFRRVPDEPVGGAGAAAIDLAFSSSPQ
jgi:hypothetical protein